MNMSLKEQDFAAIGEYIQTHFADWLRKYQTLERYVPESLLERLIRVEEELKHLRETIIEGLHRSDDRFEQIEKRFEQLEERLEQIERHFESIDKQFEQIEVRLKQMEGRFEPIDKRFEQLIAQMCTRFDQSDKRFDSLTKRMDRFMAWTFGLAVSTSGIVIAVLR